MPLPPSRTDSGADTLEGAARLGDRAAFTTVLRQHDPQLRRLAYSILGGNRDAMDDVLQDAYLRAYRNLAGFRGDASFATWLTRIVTNACMDELRRGQRRPRPVDMREPTWDRPGAAPGPEALAAAGDTLAALAELPDEQRVAVVLVDGEGYDHATVARLLDVAPGTVASRLSRARARLRDTIRTADPDRTHR